MFRPRPPELFQLGPQQAEQRSTSARANAERIRYARRRLPWPQHRASQAGHLPLRRRRSVGPSSITCRQVGVRRWYASRRRFSHVGPAGSGQRPAGLRRPVREGEQQDQQQPETSARRSGRRPRAATRVRSSPMPSSDGTPARRHDGSGPPRCPARRRRCEQDPAVVPPSCAPRLRCVAASARPRNRRRSRTRARQPNRYPVEQHSSRRAGAPRSRAHGDRRRVGAGSRPLSASSAAARYRTAPASRQHGEPNSVANTCRYESISPRSIARRATSPVQARSSRRHATRERAPRAVEIAGCSAPRRRSSRRGLNRGSHQQVEDGDVSKQAKRRMQRVEIQNMPAA